MADDMGSVFAPPQGTAYVQPYTPSWSERIGAWFQDALQGAGASRGYSQEFGQKAQQIAGLVPGLGQALSANDAYRQYQGGNYLGAALSGAAALPIPGAGIAGDAARAVEPEAAGAARDAIRIIKNQAFPDYVHYGIERADGTPLGMAGVELSGHDAAGGNPTTGHIASIGGAGYSPITGAGAADSANTLGPAAVRALLRQFQADFPSVRSLTGDRVSGARFGGGYENEIGKARPVSLQLPH